MITERTTFFCVIDHAIWYLLYKAWLKKVKNENVALFITRARVGDVPNIWNTDPSQYVQFSFWVDRIFLFK